jgi:hypothetical protein
VARCVRPSVRARTGLELPDVFALATAIQAERRGSTDVSLASFDRKVLKAHAAIRSRGWALVCPGA